MLVYWNSENDNHITDWSLKGTGMFELITLEDSEIMAIDAARKFDSTENYGYNYIQSASECYGAARCLELRISIDEKDKIVDELLIRRLRTLARNLFEQGMNQVNFSQARQRGEVDT